MFVAELTPTDVTNYYLTVEKPGYAFANLNVTLPAAGPEAQEVQKKVSLRPMQTGTRSVLRNIYFEFDKASFLDDSYRELNKLEKLLSQNPGTSMEIGGHTDNVGGKKYNVQLSQRRANAVVDYLKNKGVDTRRLKAVGYGDGRPLASNDDSRSSSSSEVLIGITTAASQRTRLTYTA